MINKGKIKNFAKQLADALVFKNMFKVYVANNLGYICHLSVKTKTMGHLSLLYNSATKVVNFFFTQPLFNKKWVVKVVNVGVSIAEVSYIFCVDNNFPINFFFIFVAE